MKTWLYFIGSVGAGRLSGPTKIGITGGSLVSRHREIQTGNPLRTVLVEAFSLPSREEARELESTLHEEMGHCRLNGEWFDTHPIDAVEESLWHLATIIARHHGRGPVSERALEHFQCNARYADKLDEAMAEKREWLMDGMAASGFPVMPS